MAPKKGKKRPASSPEAPEDATKDAEMAEAEAVNGEEAVKEAPAEEAEADGDAGEAADGDAEAGEAAEGDDAAAETEEDKEGDAEAPEKAEPPVPPKKVFDVEWSAEVVEDTRPKIKEATVLNEHDADITCVIQDNVISSVPSEQFKYILSGARATTGISSGRYVFEVHYLAALAANTDARYQTLRIGVGLAGSSLVPGSDDLSAGLDTEGSWWSAGKCIRHGRQLRVNDVVAIVVNLDKSSERCGTCSIFVNGTRVGEPVKLEEKLTGGPLFPLIAVRNVSAMANFGPGRPFKELPFKGVMLNDAASADVTKAAAGPPKDGKYEVLVPISMPNKGTFDYLDFCFYPSAGKKYVEISERALVKIMESSGLAPPKDGRVTNKKTIAAFNVKELMDNKFQTAFLKMAMTKKRNYVLMDVAKNLQKPARTLNLSYFKAPHFKCRALVALGEPSSEFLAAVQKELYTKAVEKKKADVERQKNVWTKAQAIKEKKKEAEANLKAKKAAADAKKEEKAENEEEKAETADGAAEETKEEPKEETKEEPKEEEADVEPDWEELMKVDPDQFKEKKFIPKPFPDINPDHENTIFSNFSIPDEGVIPERADRRWLPQGETLPPPGPEEGFAKVDFVWANKEGAIAALGDWVKHKKKTEMVKGFRASKECGARVMAWNKSKSEWRLSARKDAEAAKKAPDLKLPSKAAAVTKADGDAKDDEEKPEATEDAQEEPPEDDEMEEEVDVWTTENIHEVNGKRLYKDFDEDDWTLATFRFELLNMLVSFQTDVTSKDADRVGIAKSLATQYYKAYYGRDLVPRAVGQDTLEGVITYFKDVVKVDDDILALALELPEGDENLFTTVVKCTEVARRERRNRVAAGDESAKLNIKRQGGDKGKGKGKGGKPQGGGGKGNMSAAPKGKGKGPAITTGKGKPMLPPRANPNQYAPSPYPQAPGYGGGGAQKRPVATVSSYGPLAKKPRPTAAPQAPAGGGYYAKTQAYTNYNQYRGGRR